MADVFFWQAKAYQEAKDWLIRNKAFKISNVTSSLMTMDVWCSQMRGVRFIGCWISLKYNNILFLVPHLRRAQNIYKDIRIHSFHLTPTHTRVCAWTTNICITGDGLVEWEERKQHQYAVENFTSQHNTTWWSSEKLVRLRQLKVQRGTLWSLAVTKTKALFTVT